MKISSRLTALLLAGLTFQGSGDAQAHSTFAVDQLEQIVAPIALYPDALMAQVLMASTYPLEIVQAQRWSQANPGLSGKALEEPLQQQDWDPSVKSLCGFPSVLKKMNDDLEWTQDLGEAFLAQKSELLDAVQRMRQKALESDNLKSTEQQTVTQDGKIIVIQPASTEVIYVPAYSPTVVYGAWSYPTWYYPPMYVPPPPGYGALAFTAGAAWGAAVWGNCDWHGSDVNINVNRYNQFNKNTSLHAEQYNLANTSASTAQWNHDPEHRQGVNYQSAQTAQRYGSTTSSSAVSKSQARGYGAAAEAGRASTKTAEPRASSYAAPSSTAQHPSSAATSYRASGTEGSALSGSSNASLERSASERGAASRGSMGGGGRRRG